MGQQQQNLMQQQRQQYQRQLSLDNPYQQNEVQDQLNYHQDQRRHHSHDRVDRSSRNNYQQDQQENYDRGGGHNREDRSRGGFDRQHSQGSNDSGTEVMIADLTILEITATNTVVGDIKVDEDIESKNAKDYPYLSIHSKVTYKRVLKTVQLHITEDLDKFGKKVGTVRAPL